MNTKMLEKKRATSNGSRTAVHPKVQNGDRPKATKKSLNERLMERYGVDDSEAAKSTLRAWKKTYENREQFIK